MLLNHNHSRAARETVVTLYIHDQAKTPNKRVIKKKQMEIIYIWMILQLEELSPRMVLEENENFSFNG